VINGKELGREGENAVAKFLEKKGYRIISKNYNTRLGEVDLIAEKDEFLAFVEVKTRTFAYFDISSCVTYTKQRRIIKAAKLFISRNGIDDKVCRFDVAAVLKGKDGGYYVDYIEDAFREG
jgi:putative endonuclease